MPAAHYLTRRAVLCAGGAESCRPMRLRADGMWLRLVVVGDNLRPTINRQRLG